MAQLHVTRVRREFREVVNSEEVERNWVLMLYRYPRYLLCTCAYNIRYSIANSITATYVRVLFELNSLTYEMFIATPDLTSYM